MGFFSKLKEKFSKKEVFKDEKQKECKDKEIWREMAIKNEQLMLENQRVLLSSNKPNIFKKFKQKT